ncbi:MAG: cobalamin-independent methionine synthase II family protein [Mycobacteriales bacterium]
MQISSERILTTHTGSLPRPADLAGTSLLDPAAPDPGEEQIRAAVAAIVRSQRDADVDVVNDGEVSKKGYSTYITERLDGFGGSAPMGEIQDYKDFPEWAARLSITAGADGESLLSNPACVGPVSYRDTAAVDRDVANLKSAAEGSGATEVFMSAASPGVISIFQQNQHYPSEDDYIAALAEAMKTEYDAIAAAGLILQLDCPDLAMGWNVSHLGGTAEGFQAAIGRRVEAINYATRDIPAEQMRLHLCWGNYEGPHHLDVPIADIIGTVFKARPAAISFEASNPRHEHEYVVFDDVKLPDGKVLIPGVLDSTTNYIEHPELVAQRIVRYAERVGRENVLAGSDCGFATFAQLLSVDPAITWAKLGVMAQGARLASQRLWSKAA